MKQLLLIGAVLAALVVVGTAASANTPDPELDAAASFIAGHPVTVWCEMSWSDWLGMTNGVDGVPGFTRPPTPVIYVDPQVCLTLLLLAQGDDTGTIYAGQALLTLAHESELQHGVTDEGAADCAALPYVATLATEFFGIGSTSYRTVTATRIVTVRLGNRVKRIRETYTKRVAVPNPFLVLTVQAAKDADRREYPGAC